MSLDGLIVAAALFAIAIWHSFEVRARWSVTLDETFYFANAVEITRSGRLPDTLSQSGVAPLPVLISYLIPAIAAGDIPRPATWFGSVHDRHNVNFARSIHSLVVAVPLLLVVMVWLAARKGLWCGAAGSMVLALSPTLAAHGSLATTDCMLTLGVLLELAALANYWRQPGFVRLTLVALAFAFAFSSKYSAAFLLPIAMGVVAIRPGGSKAGLTAGLRGQLLLLTAIFFFTWGFHGFQISRHAAGGIWPEFLDGVLDQMRHQREGHDSFLLGKISTTGWWYFFPLAFACKSTPVELVLALLSVILAARELMRFRFERMRSSTSASLGLWIVAAGIYWLAAISSSVQIGHRFLLPIYPLMTLIAFDVLWTLTAGRRWIATALSVTLIAGQAASLWAIRPHYLSYFNRFAGGPENGYKLFVDSSIDWGQDLPALQKELVARKYRSVLLKYFGTSPPGAYGIDSVWFDGRDLEATANCDWVAISVTELQGPYLEGDPFRDFRELKPDARAGYSIMIYDRRKPQVEAAIQSALKIVVANRANKSERSRSDNDRLFQRIDPKRPAR